jgi:hypothetical protein
MNKYVCTVHTGAMQGSISTGDSATSGLSSDNPFGNSNNQPIGELQAVQKLTDWNEDGQIDGQDYGELDIVGYLVEWNEAS